MMFIGIALLVAVGLTVAINADAGSLFGLSQWQAGHAAPLVLILILVASALFARRRPVGELIGGLVLWIGIFALVVTGYTYRDDIMSVASRVYGELTPGKPIVDRTGAVSFRRGLSGHFEVEARINGAAIPLVFDTGASAVVLKVSDARKAGLDTSHLVFDTPVSTANGMGRAAVVNLDRIDIGGIVRRNTRAYITADSALDTSLLGMTYLETLSRYAVTRDSLELNN